MPRERERENRQIYLRFRVYFYRCTQNLSSMRHIAFSQIYRLIFYSMTLSIDPISRFNVNEKNRHCVLDLMETDSFAILLFEHQLKFTFAFECVRCVLIVFRLAEGPKVILCISINTPCV